MYTRTQTAANNGGCYALQMCMGDEFKNSWRTNLQKLADEVYERIMHWDIRQAAKLFEIFPGFRPRGAKWMCIDVGYNEKGDWILIFR